MTNILSAANQITDLVEAIQRFRYQAKSAGNLRSDDHIKVVEEGTVIRIEPANPQVIVVWQSHGTNFGTAVPRVLVGRPGAIEEEDGDDENCANGNSDITGLVCPTDLGHRPVDFL